MRAFLLFCLLLFAAHSLGASVIGFALEGYRSEDARREWEEAFSFRLRLKANASGYSGNSVAVFSSKPGRAAVIAEAARRGCASLLVWNQAERRADLYALPGGQIREISFAPQQGEGQAGGRFLRALTEMECLEAIARSIEGGRVEEAIMLDVVFIVETGGRMYRLLPDAAAFISGFTRTIQSALPQPDARFGLLSFSSSERIACRDFTNSPAAFADEIRTIKPPASPGRVSLEQIFSRLADAWSWRAGSRRCAILYMNSQIDAVPSSLDKLKAAGIRLITIPADGASTKTHELLQAIARANGGSSLIPDYLVRYSEAGQRRRAFYLFERTLYPLAHDVAEQNWYEIYDDIRETASTGILSRRYRAGTIDESCEIITRSGVKGIRIAEIKSSLPRTAALALARLQKKNESFSFAIPDSLMRLEHARRTYVIPVVNSLLARFAERPDAARWLGFAPVFDAAHEDGFFPNAGTLVLLPATLPPPALLQRNWRDIAGRAGRELLFQPGRAFVRLENAALTPIARKRFVVEE